MDEDKIIVIHQPWGGLGDNLQFSMLPEYYSKQGYSVYLSKSNAYRNPEIKKLVWDLNPYVKGELDRSPNAGACRGIGSDETMPYLSRIEQSHGLPPVSKYPMIYYQPKPIQHSFVNPRTVLLLDPTSIATYVPDQEVRTFFEGIIRHHPEYKPHVVQFSAIANRESDLFPELPKILIHSLFDYCDWISACPVFGSLFSGSSVLASAIKRDRSSPIIYTYRPTSSNLFVFDNAHYTFGGAFRPPPVQKQALSMIEFKGHHYPAFQAQGNAAQFAIPFAKQMCIGHGYDIGFCREEWKLPGAIGIDAGLNNGFDADHLPEANVDYIFSSHCLEHVEDWVVTLEYWLTMIRPGGILFLYLPDFSQVYWRPWHNRKHRHCFTPELIKGFLQDHGGKNILVSGLDLNNSFMAVCTL